MTKRERVAAFLEHASEEEKALVNEIWERTKLDNAWKQMQLIKLNASANEAEKQVMLEAREMVRQAALLEAWQKVRFGIFPNGKSFHHGPKRAYAKR